jgi:3-dehydroquinate synthetase
MTIASNLLLEPAAVLVDPETLVTLPLRHLRAGLAEVIKHGVIADAQYLHRVTGDVARVLDAAADRRLEVLSEIVVRSIEIKASVVNRDSREAGLRKTLNFGHTLGHAIELCSSFEMLHGEAVAIGMVLESELAERAGIAEHGTASQVREAVTRAGLPSRRPPAHDPARLLAATRLDKKARRGLAEYSLPRRIGEMACEERGWTCPVNDELVLEVLS